MKPFLNWNNLISSLFMFNYSWWYKIQTSRKTQSHPWISFHTLSHKTFQLSLYYVQGSKLCFSYVLQEKLLVKISCHASMKKNLADSQQKFGSRTTLALYMLNDWLEQENKLLKSYWEQQLGTPEIRVMQKQKTWQKIQSQDRIEIRMSFLWLDLGPPLGLPGCTIYFLANLNFLFILKKKKKEYLVRLLSWLLSIKTFLPAHIKRVETLEILV